MKSFRKSIRRTAQSLKIFKKPERDPTPPPPKPSALAIAPHRILITGGAGHVAKQLVKKLEEDARDILHREVSLWMHWDLKHNQKPLLSPSSFKRKERQLMVLIDQEVEKLLRTRIQIVLVDVFDMEHSSIDNHITLVKGSFTNERKMKTALDRIETVYHLAAVGMTGRFARDRKACLAINSVGTMNFLSWCKIQGVERFIYVSSIGTIFTGDPLENAEEVDDEYPEKFYNYYCESKSHAERIVRKASCVEMKTIIIRFNGIYGPGEKRVTERVVGFMKSGWWIATCKPGGKEAKTQLSSVSNCVQGLVKADEALRFADAKPGRVYHIVDSQPIGTFSFWTPLNNAFGFSEPFLTIHPWLLRILAWSCEILAFIFRFDPFLSVLEVDLLCVTTTFSLDRARRELHYNPEPCPMDQIVDLYSGQVKKKDLHGNPTSEFTDQWKAFLDRRTKIIYYSSLMAIIALLIVSCYGAKEIFSLLKFYFMEFISYF